MTVGAKGIRRTEMGTARKQTLRRMHKWGRKIGRKPVSAIALTIVFTFLLLMPLCINAGYSYIAFRRVITRDIQIQQLTDKVTYLDEVLTMSAKMNAATGERQWEARYFEFVPQLEAAINRISELDPQFYQGEGTAETEMANNQLVAMEAQAFSLVRNGDLASALALLGGRAYQEQKQIYLSSVRRSNEAIAHQIIVDRRNFSRTLWTSCAISGLSFLVLLPMWIGVLKMTGRYLRALETERNKTSALTANLEQRVEQRTFELTRALKDLQQTQSQLVQTEKMSSLGEMVAGIAHEINNPISFIRGNIPILSEYFQDMLDLIKIYEMAYPQPVPLVVEQREDMDMDFVSEDVPKILSSMKMGTARVRDIVLSLRNYSRLDEAVLKDVDIHEGLESTLLILNHRIKNGIEVVKNYGSLPAVTCSPSQINQVFTNILTNALDALSENSEALKKITITTGIKCATQVQISIRDTGEGMSPEVKRRIFDPFFTTKPVGKGTGLGMGICFKIIEQHQGKIDVKTALGEGTEFIITLPVQV